MFGTITVFIRLTLTKMIPGFPEGKRRLKN